MQAPIVSPLAKKNPFYPVKASGSGVGGACGKGDVTKLTSDTYAPVETVYVGGPVSCGVPMQIATVRQQLGPEEVSALMGKEVGGMKLTMVQPMMVKASGAACCELLVLCCLVWQQRSSMQCDRTAALVSCSGWVLCKRVVTVHVMGKGC